MFSFGFKQTSGTVSAASNLFRLFPATGFALATQFIRCKFVNIVTGDSYISQECYKNSLNEYIIRPPNTNALALAEWQVIIFAPAYVSDNRGIQFPTSAIENTFQINMENLAAAISETNSFRFRVFDKRVMSGSGDYFVRNTGGQQNLLKFTFQCTTALATTGFIKIEFPLLDATATINDKDLGTGLLNEKAIGCNVKRNGAVDTGAVCTLNVGSAHEYKPTYVKIASFAGAASASDTYTITLSVKNLALVNVWNSAFIFTQASDLSYLDMYHIPKLTYTVTQAVTSTVAAFPTAGFSNVVVQNALNIAIPVAPTTPVTLTQANHRLRFTHNDRFYGGTTEAVAGGHTLDIYANDIDFISFGSDPGATSQTFTVQNLVNPISDLAFVSTFAMSVLERKVIYQQVDYTGGATPTFTFGSFSSISITPASFAQNEMTLYTVSFQSDKMVPVGGAF
jgi:hypothetical protein